MIYKFKIYVKDDLDCFIYSPKLQKENTKNILKGMFISSSLYYFILTFWKYINKKKFKKYISVKYHQL